MIWVYPLHNFSARQQKSNRVMYTSDWRRQEISCSPTQLWGRNDLKFKDIETTAITKGIKRWIREVLGFCKRLNIKTKWLGHNTLERPIHNNGSNSSVTTLVHLSPVDDEKTTTKTDAVKSGTTIWIQRAVEIYNLCPCACARVGLTSIHWAYSTFGRNHNF